MQICWGGRPPRSPKAFRGIIFSSPSSFLSTPPTIFPFPSTISFFPLYYFFLHLLLVRLISFVFDYWNTLRHTATPCNTMQRPCNEAPKEIFTCACATHRNTLQRTATRMMTLQREAADCSALQCVALSLCESLCLSCCSLSCCSLFRCSLSLSLCPSVSLSLCPFYFIALRVSLSSIYHFCWWEHKYFAPPRFLQLWYVACL